MEHMTQDFAMMRHGPVCVVVWRGKANVEAIPLMKQLVTSGAKAYPDGVVVVAVLESTSEVPDATTRAQFAAANDELVDHGVRAMVGVMGQGGFFGAVVRGITATLHRLSSKRFPMNAFATTAEAVAWSASKTGSHINQADCVAAIEGLRRDFKLRLEQN